MIVVRISGPQKEVGTEAQRIKTLMQATGKVVRHYINSCSLPDTIPPCDVAIIEQKEITTP